MRYLAFLLPSLLLCGSLQATTIINGSFEADTYHTWPGYSNQAGNGPITGWTEGSPSGQGLNPTTDPNNPCCGPGPFGPGAPGVLASPDGGQWAFMQQATTLSQVLTGLSIGTAYTISYFDAHRNGDGGPGDNLVAEIDGNPILTTTPTLTWAARSFNFTATATSQTLTFMHSGLAGDQTVALDGVKIAAVPEPASFVLCGLGAIGLFAAARRRRKA